MKLMVVGLAVWSYHVERNRLGLENKIIDPEFPPTGVEVGCCERLGGSLCYDYRDAAWNRRFEFSDTTGYTGTVITEESRLEGFRVFCGRLMLSDFAFSAAAIT